MNLRYLAAVPALAAVQIRQRLVRPAPGSFRTLLFHDIMPEQYDRFAALIAAIASNEGFITPSQAAARLRGEMDGAAGQTRYLISFDDGFASNRDIAERVLAKHGVRALFFVCPGLVDLPLARRPEAVAQGIFDGRVASDSVIARRPLMEWDDIRALSAAGHEIGAHSLMHRRLAGLQKPILHREVTGSCDRLAEVLGRACTWFAWPFGDIDSLDQQALSAIARQVPFCRSGIRGLNRPGQNRLTIFSDHVDLSAPVPWQKLVLAGGLDVRYAGVRERLNRMAAAVD